MTRSAYTACASVYSLRFLAGSPLIFRELHPFSKKRHEDTQKENFFHGAFPLSLPQSVGYRRTSITVATNTSDPMPAKVMIADTRPTTAQQLLNVDLNCMTGI